MRSSTAGEQTVLAGDYKTYYRVDLEDPLGVMQDMASYSSLGWLCSVTLDFNQDEPIAGATVTLRREINISGGLGYTTLAPLRTDSPANPSGSTVSVYRYCKVYIACVTGSRPTALSTDWKLKFDGITDQVEEPENSTIVVKARDKGAYLQDAWIAAAGEMVNYAQSFSQLGPTIVRNSYTDARWVFAEADWIVSPTDGDLARAFRTFKVDLEPAMEALQRAASKIGADFRMAWNDSASEYRPTLTIPERTSPVSAWTFGNAGIVSWKKFDIDRLAVRNIVIVNYLPAHATTRAVAVASDSASIITYGRRVIAAQEADDSTIDSSTEATSLASDILADLKDPSAIGEMEMLPDWRCEIGDYYTFSPNKYFDVAQDLAVVGVRYELNQNQQRMFLEVRGKPSAGYRRWIDIAKRVPASTDVNDRENGLSGITHEDTSDASSRTFSWTRGSNVSFVAFYEAEVSAPVTASAYPAPDTIPALVAGGTAGASTLPSSTDSWTAVRPHFGNVRIGMAVPYYKLGGRWGIGNVVKFEVIPGLNDDPKRAVVAFVSSSVGLTTTAVALTVYDPSLFRQNGTNAAVWFQLDDVQNPPDSCDANSLNDTFTATFTTSRASVDSFIQIYFDVCTRSMYDSSRGLGVIGVVDHTQYTVNVTVPHT